jgi:hypothetical protein
VRAVQGGGGASLGDARRRREQGLGELLVAVHRGAGRLARLGRCARCSW